jgi:hypothetical protein
MLRRLFHRSDEIPSPRERARWARCLRRLVDQAERRDRANTLRAFRPIHPAALMRASAPALMQIREALLDPHTPVSRVALRRLDAFVCDGARSPLFGGTPEGARRAALELRSAFLLPAEVESRLAA